jgi:hypothetical protein
MANELKILLKKASADAQAAAVHTPNVMQTMMLFQQAQHRAKASEDHAKATQDQAKVVNKVTRLVCRWRRTTMLLKKRFKSCDG